MASKVQQAPSRPQDSLDLDRQSPMAAQGELAWPGRSMRGRLRMRTLVTLRWVVILGEVALLLVAGLLMGFKAPYALCFGLIGAAAWINLLTGVASPGQRMTGAWEATGQLAFDIVQITGLLYLTGGIGNPFSLMLIAPVTLAAATLPIGPVAVLGALGILGSFGLVFFRFPMKPDGGGFGFHASYMLGSAFANTAGIVVIAGYVRQAAEESARMALALDVTQSVLSREQRLSALGALAAAAAHELGTPLATISIVAKEMAREATLPNIKEDADLLVAQAARCREILRRLTDAPDAAKDEVHERLSLVQLLHEVLEPHADVKGVRVEAIVTGAPGVTAPDIRRMPEVLHALTSFVENAVDFAASEVLVTARFDAQSVAMEVRDDGPGFAPDILAKLGEPYVTTRPGAEGSRTGHIGMGLGFFIAKTLLERTGAQVAFQNARPHGAVVSARWARAAIEVSADG